MVLSRVLVIATSHAFPYDDALGRMTLLIALRYFTKPSVWL